MDGRRGIDQGIGEVLSDEPGPDRLEPSSFRDAMRRVVTAVHIVTTDGAAGRAGLTASAVASVSDRPPTILVCLNGESRSAARLIENAVFCVNTLAVDEEDIAHAFAGLSQLPSERRFELGVWDRLRTGAPVLQSCLVAFDCRMTDVRRVATHDVVLGEVLAIRPGAGRPLAYFDRQYRAL